MPLHVEILYGEYQFAAAFAVASLLAVLAVFTLVIKHWVEWQAHRQLSAPPRVAAVSQPPLPAVQHQGAST
jgi:ABC-type sulfate transport system permease subunit